MVLLNGPWLFFYSADQAEKPKEFAESEGKTPVETFVEIDGEMKEYTECIYDYYPKPSNYIDHDKRFDDSEFIGKIQNPSIKSEVVKNECFNRT